MKLIDKTGREVKVGDQLTSFRDEQARVLALIPPPDSSKSGKIKVQWIPEKPGHEGVYYVGVFGCTYE